MRLNRPSPFRRQAPKPSWDFLSEFESWVTTFGDMLLLLLIAFVGCVGLFALVRALLGAYHG